MPALGTSTRRSLAVVLLGGLAVTAAVACRGNMGPGETRTDPDRPPVEGIVAHAAVRLVPRYAERRGITDRPAERALLLTLLPGGTGLLAIDSRDRPGEGGMDTVTWRQAGNEITLTPGAIGGEFEGIFRWDAWRLRLADEDGDGVLESGRGTARGDYHSMRGDVADGSDYEATLTASAPREGPVAAVRGPAPPLLGGGSGRPLSVFDRVEVVFSQPVPWAQVASGLRLLLDGQPVQATPTPMHEVHGFVTGAVVPLGDFPPFGATFSLDPGAITDPAGNAARWNEQPLRTPPDPGPLTTNPGFERGPAGWIVEGNAQVQGTFEGLAPAEGAAHAVVTSGGRLTGYLDVPAEATRLELSVAAFGEGRGFDSGRSGVVELHAAGTSAFVFDAAAREAEAVECEDCQSYGARIGPLRVEADLAPFRGRRVFLTVSATGSNYFGFNYYAVVVDDIRVR